MADVFFKADVNNLLQKKHIVFIGDSNLRAMYKDLIWLLNYNEIIDQAALKKKQEPSFCGDKLNKHSELHRGRDYKEERSYKKGDTTIEFYFITKCYNPMLVDMMEDIHLGLREAPDVIYMNSTLWDINRWGPNFAADFKDNLQKLARLFKSSLPPSTLVIWATALPVSNKIRSSLLIKQIAFLQHTLRFDVMEANMFARQVMANHGFDVLDNHFYMRMQVHRRGHDGIHYSPTAVRFLTNLLLTHIALSWDVPLPNRVNTILLDKAKALCGGKAVSAVSEPSTPVMLANKTKMPPPPPHVLAKRLNCSWSQQNMPRGKFKKNRRNVPYKKKGPNAVVDSYHKPLKGGDRRDCNRNQDYNWDLTWSEVQPPAMSSWSTDLPWANNAPQSTNWSEDYWPTENMFNSQPVNTRAAVGYNHNSILSRATDMLAQNMRHPYPY